MSSFHALSTPGQSSFTSWKAKTPPGTTWGNAYTGAIDSAIAKGIKVVLSYWEDGASSGGRIINMAAFNSMWNAVPERQRAARRVGPHEFFTFVEDAIAATVASLTRGAGEFAYNVGGGQRVALREVLDLIERLVGRAIVRRHVEPQHGDPRDTAADTRLARRDLGYEPRTNLERGLERQWEWQRNT